ncbi:MAG: hypothetical protein NT068_00160 [Candidatus Nomurabacteria bacterium]|nr:hypothetical protein [Candidatus Nomurabacteria bacterium]
MKKFVTFYSSINDCLIIFLPLICSSIIYPGSAGILIFEFFIVFVLPKVVNWIFSKNPEEYVDPHHVVLNLFILQFFIVNLLIAVFISSSCYIKNVNCGYCVPGFIIDFLSPKEIALKFVSIILAFVITHLVYRKAKEYF